MSSLSSSDDVEDQLAKALSCIVDQSIALYRNMVCFRWPKTAENKAFLPKIAYFHQHFTYFLRHSTAKK
jgi:hypothetical protein